MTCREIQSNNRFVRRLLFELAFASGCSPMLSNSYHSLGLAVWLVMKKFALLYFYAALVLFPADAVWLTVLGRGYYVDEIGGLLRSDPDLAVAVLFYVVYLCGLVVLVIKPAFDRGSVAAALLNGALLGLCAYGTYDLTNLATIKGFSLRIALIDMAWGTSLTAITASGAVWLALMSKRD